MLNRIGFVPKNSPIQPDYYSRIFNGWTAIFIAENDTEFHLSMQPDSHNPELAKSLHVLRKGKDCRLPIRTTPCKSIKEGLEIVAQLLERNKE